MMKISKRFLRILLVICMMIGVLMVGVSAAEVIASGATIYVSKEGNDNNSGTQSAPFATIEKALNEVSAGDTIRIMDEAAITRPEMDDPLCIETAVTIQGGTLSLDMAGIILGADVTFKDITLSLNNTVRNAILANGYTLTLENVTQYPNAQPIHLFCGGMTGYTGSIPTAGACGTIILSGTNKVGDLFAGSFAEPISTLKDGTTDEYVVTPGDPNTWEKPSVITVISGKNNELGTVYACGASEPRGEGKKNMTVDSASYKSTGGVTVNLSGSKPVVINGATGGNSNAAVVFAGGESMISNITFSDIASLAVTSGKLQPKTLPEEIAISIAEDAELDLSALAENFTIGDFNGGGTLVLGSNQMLIISGAVSGTTSVKLGASGQCIAAENSDNSNFTAASDLMELTLDGGIWTAEWLYIPVTDFSITDVNATITDTTASLPIDVTYADPMGNWDLDFSTIEFIVTVNGRPAEYDDTLYSYVDAETGFMLYTSIEDESFIVEPPAAFSAGTYIISITVPAEMSASGEDITKTATLTVIDSDVSYSGEAGDLEWLLYENGLLTISGEGAMPDYDYSDNRAPWYEYCELITEVEMKSGVTSIGTYAFDDCTNLVSIILPSSVTSIGGRAFADCMSLASVTIPRHMTSIGDYAFYNCTSLEHITIPDSVTSMGNVTFKGCTNLTSVVLHDQLTTIGYEAFQDCTSLANMTIPDSVTSIGREAFRGCTSLTDIDIPDSVTSLGSGAFRGCTSLMSAVISDSVTVIDYEMFDNCTSLASVTIGENVTEIRNSAFSFCDLTSVTLPDSVAELGLGVFSYCENLASVTIGSGMTEISMRAFYECSALKTVYYNGTEVQWNKITIDSTDNNYLLRANRVYIGSDGGEAGNLEWVYQNGLLTISGEGAMPDYNYSDNRAPWYEYCELITEVEMKSGVTSIGTYAFDDCTNLVSIILPSSVTGIGGRAFADCMSLASVTIPRHMTSIGDYAFYNCTSLEHITIPDSVTSMGNVTFKGCTNLTSVVLHDQLTTIGYEAFQDCTSLANMTIPDSVTSIGREAFRGCTSLTDIDIPDSVTSLGSGAFRGCTSLTDVVLGDSMISIDSYAFYDCTNLTSVTIPDGVTSIGTYAFGYCTGFENVVISNSIEEIGYAAFRGCTSLNTITYLGSKKQWNAIWVDDFNDELLGARIIFTIVSPPESPTVTIGNDFYGLPTLTWNEITGAEKYEIWRADGDGGFYLLCETEETEYYDTNAPAGTSYFYMVRAVAGDEKGEFSNIVVFRQSQPDGGIGGIAPPTPHVGVVPPPVKKP